MDENDTYVCGVHGAYTTYPFDGTDSPEEFDFEFLKWLHHNDIEGVRTYLEIDDDNDNDNEVHANVINCGILWASMKNYTEILRILISDRRVITDYIYFAMRLAVLCGSTNSLVIMANHPDMIRMNSMFRISMNMSNNTHCIKVRDLMEATNCGNLEYFQESRFDNGIIFLINNYVCFWIIAIDNLEILKILLEDPRVDPFIHGNKLIDFTIRHNRIETSKLLVNHYEKLHPIGNSDFYDDILCTAAIYDHSEFMKFMLNKFPLMELPTYQDGDNLFDMAISSDEFSTARILYNDRRIYSLDIDLKFDDYIPNYKHHIDEINGHFYAIKDRISEICKALQNLRLPALVTLKIIDQLIPNHIPMHKKWDLIAAVKHFHDRP